MSLKVKLRDISVWLAREGVLSVFASQACVAPNGMVFAPFWSVLVLIIEYRSA